MIIQLVVEGISTLPRTFARDIMHACKRANMPLVTQKDEALHMSLRNDTLTFRATKLDISSAPATDFARVSHLVTRELKAKQWPNNAAYTVTEYTQKAT